MAVILSAEYIPDDRWIEINKQARKEFPCVWISTKDGVKTETCYWDIILKDKWK